ncbi:MAG: sigma-70 family RNA polymerase sigma factor [bacterium]
MEYIFKSYYNDAMKEAELLEKILAGEPSAFKELFETYNSLVFNVCLKMLSNREDAEDVTQDVFFTAYKSLKKFRAESKLSTWLYRIAVNLSLNFQRKKKINQWLSLDFLLDNKPDEIPHSPEVNPLKDLENSERERIVQNAVNSLPENQRAAVILQRYENLSYEEIAKIMKCSVSSVESYLFRAKENLCKKLAPIIEDL